MAQLRQVTSDFSVAPQISVDDLPAIAEAGFVLLINNRPDGEDPMQPLGAQMQAAAQAAGLDYLAIPIRGAPTTDQAMEVAAACEEAGGPVLAFCRSGTRSITAWGLGQALSGARSGADIRSLAAGAGYDLSHLLG
ncbi:MAG: family phosphatase [Caulobacteraceae bacterium]|nr:family phosphatase [Caulobacteraceae bacterium]